MPALKAPGDPYAPSKYMGYKWIMRMILVSFLTALVVTALACSSGNGQLTCNGKDCTCASGTCETTCSGDGKSCSYVCQAGATCIFHCPNGSCSADCSKAVNCTMDCPGGSCSCSGQCTSTH